MGKEGDPWTGVQRCANDNDYAQDQHNSEGSSIYEVFISSQPRDRGWVDNRVVDNDQGYVDADMDHASLSSPFRTQNAELTASPVDTPAQNINPNARDNNPSKMSTPISREKTPKERSVRSLRNKHAKLSRLRDEAFYQREQLQVEYEDVSTRLADVISSQEELMNAFKGEFEDYRLSQFLTMWQTVQSDAAAFQARLARIAQLSNSLIEPEAQLMVAEDDFVHVTDKAVSSLKARDRKQSRPKPRRSQEIHISRDSHQAQPPNASLPATLSARRRYVTMLSERLNELDADQEDELLTREMLLDRGDIPQISDADFVNDYVSARRRVEQDLEEAQADVAELEASCLAKGFDMRLQTTPRLSGHEEPKEDNSHNQLDLVTKSTSTIDPADDLLLVSDGRGCQESLDSSDTFPSRQSALIRDWIEQSRLQRRNSMPGSVDELQIQWPQSLGAAGDRKSSPA